MDTTTHNIMPCVRELLADVRRAVSLSPTHSSSGLLASLQQLLPVPLTQEELNDLSPPADDRGQTSASFLYDELWQTNSLLQSLHASLQWVQIHSSHNTMFSWRAAQAVDEISDNRTPRVWRDLLPPHLTSLPSLLTVVQLLWRALDYLIHMARSGWSLPVELHPLWVFSPKDLMSRVQHCFAEQHEIPPSEVTLVAQVSEDIPLCNMLIQTIMMQVVNGPLSHSQDSSITFHSLTLCGATWNQDSFSLVVPSSPIPPSDVVCVTLTPGLSHTSHAQQYHIYHCPVLPSSDQCDSLFHIPFHTLSLPIHPFLCCHHN